MSLNTIIISRGPKGEDGGDLSQTDIDSLAKLNGIVADATLIDTGDARLSDARTPTAHTHTLAEISDAGTAAGSATGDFATAAQGSTADSALQPGGALGTPSSGTLTNCTFPTLNQSTTGNAATATALETGRTINGVVFDGSQSITVGCLAVDVTGTISLAQGGTSSTTASGARTNLGLGATDDVTHGSLTTTGTVTAAAGDFSSTTGTPALNLKNNSDLANTPIISLNKKDSSHSWGIHVGDPGEFDGYLMFVREGESTPGYAYIKPDGSFSATKISVTDSGGGLASNTSGSLAYYKPYTGSRSEIAFRGADASGLGELRINGYYNDGAWNSVSRILSVQATSAGGRIGVNNGSPTEALDVAGNIKASGTVKTGAYTVATLPTPATGMRAYVTDSNRAASTHFGSTVIAAAGGTQYTVPVFYDGTDWIIA